jgi:hypothetical protein
LGYRLTDGRVSPLSLAATGSTWGVDDGLDGLPDDWQSLYFGTDPSKWPAPNADYDGDGVSNVNEFRAGTDPTDRNSVLKTFIEASDQGFRLNWNTQAGFIYKVQKTTNLTTWTDLGALRFAPGGTDSILVQGDVGVGYYRVICVR